MSDDEKALPVPRVATRVPEVRQEYADWIPYYAPAVTFPHPDPTPYVVVDEAVQVPRVKKKQVPVSPVISNVATQVERYPNVF